MSCTANPKNEKSKDLCAQYELMHLNYCKENVERSPSTEETLCDYFTTLRDSSRFSPGDFWHMFSTLRARALRTYGVDIKNHPRLKSLLKKFAADNIKKKQTCSLSSKSKKT